MKRTVQSNKKLYALFTELGIDEDSKSTLVMSFTNDRTEHSSEMTEIEAKKLIEKLQPLTFRRKRDNELMQVLRRNIFKLMYDIGLINSYMTADNKLEYINKWIVGKLKINKELNSLNVNELTSFINQLQAIRRNYVSMTREQAMLN